MKRSIIIIIGSIIILSILGVWGYLLFFGIPQDGDDVFSDLGIGGTSDPVPTPDASDMPEDNTSSQIDTRGGGLQQLTTRPIAGFGFTGTSSTQMRYVERGTGHVYELDIETGDEVRVSGTTIPRVVEAILSPDGTYSIVVSEQENERTVLIGIIDDTDASTEYVSLADEVFDATFIDESTVGYVAHEAGNVGGYEYDITTRDPERLFVIPFSDIQLIWNDEPYIYNKPTRHFTGALYSVTSSNLTPRTPGEFGFVGGMSDFYIFGSYVQDRGYSSYALNRETDERITLPLTYVPEKCDAVERTPDVLWCASPFEDQNQDYIEDWYKGIRTSEDVLWRTNVFAGESQLVSNFLETSGRRIDVDALHSSYSGEVVLLRNKIDNTLWMYDARTP